MNLLAVNGDPLKVLGKAMFEIQIGKFAFQGDNSCWNRG